jgi:hypothetical protein
MDAPTLRLVVEGIEVTGLRILLSDFQRQLRLLLSVLNETDRHITGRSAPSTLYRIVDLSHESPATVAIEALPYDPGHDVSAQVVARFMGIVSSIDADGSLPESVPTSILAALREMAVPVGRTLARVSVESNARSVSLNRAFRLSLDRLLLPEETFPGSIRGMLEAINVHEGANVMRVYPDVGPSKVSCHFGAELQDAAISGVGKFVQVTGTLVYKAAAPYPHKINVDALQVFPESHELPTLTELRGSAPNATGALPSEEFVRSLRNETV